MKKIVFLDNFKIMTYITNMSDTDEKFPKERRKAPRVSGAIVEYTTEEDSSIKKAFIKDICIYGICIYVPESFEIGSKLNLDIFLFGDDIPIHAKGRVIWQKSGGYLGYYNMGIEFKEISDAHSKILDDHIMANYKEEEPQ